MKTGKLSVGSRAGDAVESPRGEDEEKKYSVSPSLVKPCNRKNAVFDSTNHEINSEETSNKVPNNGVTKEPVKETKMKEKNKKCCTVS